MTEAAPSSGTTAEHARLAQATGGAENDLFESNPWYEWGPYLSERAWGTVREDYSNDGDAWSFFPHDHARSRAYRWNEDGLAGFCNRFQNLCLGLALWNGKDPILKERLFGLTSHAYMRMLYRYPQVEYPYARLVAENRRRSRAEPEFELVDALGDALRA